MGASLWLARSLAQPMESIEHDASQLAAGRLDLRVRSEGPIEARRLADGLNSMARDLRERLESMRRARIEIETILSSMQEGVVAVDARERVVLMNQAAAKLLGLRAPLEAGASLWEHLRYPELERGLRAVLGGQASWHGDAASPAQDGRTIGLSVARVGHHDGGDRPLAGAVALLSDVTAIRRLEQVRIDFVANVSHELRTPLAAVMGALETLADPDPEPATRARFLDIGNRNAARLQAIVSDLLDLSSIEAEGDRMPLEPVRADAPLRTAAGALAGAAEAKGVRLELPGPSARPAWVRGNAQRLDQVFTNLLENAIKYTPTGGRVVARVNSTASEVVIEVEDSGMGIPASALPRIFERFYRVDRSRSRDMGGTGLGLAIVKHVVRAHGGTVSVKSEEGQGSTFVVALPRIPDPPKNT
jgi:two-component system phosphate regulon sensor histidine kinase PhoR